MMESSIKLGLILLVLTIVSNCEGLEEFTRLTNRGILTFQNRLDGGFITAINLPDAPRAPIVSTAWSDLPGQKWRDISATFSNSYQLKPVANMNKVMEYDYNMGTVYQDNSGLGLGNTQYWSFLYVGHGYHLIKNYSNGKCLESRGLGQPLYVSDCNSSPRQQWAIHEL